MPPDDANLPHDAPPQGPEPTGRDPLWVLLVVIGLTALAYVVVDRLMSDSRLQDCVMAGHKNCTDSDDAPMRK